MPGSDWWSGMSANLVADLITVAIVYVMGRRLVDRSARNKVAMRTLEIIGYEPVVNEAGREVAATGILVQVANYSPEPILNLACSVLAVPGTAERLTPLGIDWPAEPEGFWEVRDILGAGAVIQSQSVVLSTEGQDIFAVHFTTGPRP